MTCETFSSGPLAVHGKFLRRGDNRFFLRAMRPDQAGGSLDFSAKLEFRLHLDRLRAANTNAIVVAGAQAETLIDLGAGAGLDAILEINLPEAGLAGRAGFSRMRDEVCRTVSHYRNHHSVIGFLLAPETRPGAGYTPGAARRMARLLAAIQRHCAGRFVAVRHQAGTLSLPGADEDLIWCVLPAMAADEQTAAMLALHNRAEARPVIIEFEGLDQDYASRIAAAFQCGAAGVLAPSYLPPATGGLGLRCLQPAAAMPFAARPDGPVAAPNPPLVSVIVCAFNAQRTLRGCLESLRALNYPRREVIVVDDGSSDETAAIAARFAEFRLIRQPHSGLGAARNTGARAARGEIIAFTDADCLADPDWLTLLVDAMDTGEFDLCGGPNFAPHETRRAAACVSAAPGAPCHVLTADNRAEHLSGCNLAVRAAALTRLGGFDPQFTAAGDDVDICWRALEAGMRVGFSPAAFVWHHRRNRARAYYRQQRGYGIAEAMLYRKYPERFNALGQINWQGRIPGLERMLPAGKPASAYDAGPGGIASEQSDFEPPRTLLRFLPQSLEWHGGAMTAAIILWSAGISALPAMAPLAMSLTWALYWGWHAPLERPHRGLGSRLLISWLAWTGPLIRAAGRYRHGLTTALSRRDSLQSVPRQRPRWRGRRLHLGYCNQASIARDPLLERIAGLLRHGSLTAKPGSGWDDYDLELRPGAFAAARITTADEEHEGSYRKNLVMVKAVASPLGATLVWMGIGLAMALSIGGHRAAAQTAAVAAALLAGLMVAEALVTTHLAYLAVERAAQQLGLDPVGQPTASPMAVRTAERITAAQGTS